MKLINKCFVEMIDVHDVEFKVLFTTHYYT